MGGDKTTTQGSNSYQMSPEEKQVYQNMNNFTQATQSGAISSQNNMYNILNSLFSGIMSGKSDSPLLQQALNGISPEVTKGLTQNALASIYPQFQNAGILDSGTAAQISAKTAGDIGLNSAQWNIGNIENLLGLGFSGQNQAQNSYLQNNSTLAGLVKGTGSGSSSGSTIGMNPFLKSFQTSAGSKLGGFVGGLPGSFAGSFGSVG